MSQDVTSNHRQRTPGVSNEARGENPPPNSTTITSMCEGWTKITQQLHPTETKKERRCHRLVAWVAESWWKVGGKCYFANLVWVVGRDIKKRFSFMPACRKLLGRINRKEAYLAILRYRNITGSPTSTLLDGNINPKD